MTYKAENNLKIKYEKITKKKFLRESISKNITKYMGHKV